MLSGPMGEDIAPRDHLAGHRVLDDLAIAPVGGAAGKSYEDLYVEHAPAARRLALSMVPRDVAEDIVAEAFTRVLTAIRAGGGPGLAFRAYLLTAVRNLANDWNRARRRMTVAGDVDLDAEKPGAGQTHAISRLTSGADTQAAARAEERLVARAFAKLPVRWRAVLWQLEVEGKAPAAVAPMFGLTANGVSALAMRAREGLRQAYLQEHIGANIPVACRAYAAELGAGARGRLSRRRRGAVHEHLRQCHACTDLFTELTEINSRLGAIITPAALAAASAGVSVGRRALLMRTGLIGSWRTWRLHPTTAVAGTAAGLAVAGGMVFAVNVMPATTGPSQPGVRPAASSTAFGASGRNAPGQPGNRSAGSGTAASASALAPLTGATGATAGACAGAGPAVGLACEAQKGASATAAGGTGTSGANGAGTSAAGTGNGPSGQAPNAAGSRSTGPVRKILRGVAANVSQAVANAAQTIGNTLGTTGSDLGGAVGSTVNNLGGTVGTSTNGLGGAVSGVTGGLGGTVGTVSGNLGNVLGNLGKVPH